MTDCIRFAHRGAPGRGVPGNSLIAFAEALRNGAEGIESDVRLTADGMPVLVHGLGRVQGQPLRTLHRTELPAHIPALADLWEHCGSDFQLALDMSDPDAAEAVVELARRYDAVSRLWLTYWRLPALTVWRERWPDVHLVYATMFGFPAPLLRRTVQNVAAAGVDALNLHHRLVARGTAPTVHAAGLKLFAWGLRGSAQLRRARKQGADAVFVDDLGNGA
ncbi:MAG: glycerophosphodiester phosphodiesterase [Dehalococcoidia bacterium]